MLKSQLSYFLGIIYCLNILYNSFISRVSEVTGSSNLSGSCEHHLSDAPGGDVNRSTWSWGSMGGQRSQSV